MWQVWSESRAKNRITIYCLKQIKSLQQRSLFKLQWNCKRHVYNYCPLRCTNFTRFISSFLFDWVFDLRYISISKTLVLDYYVSIKSTRTGILWWLKVSRICYSTSNEQAVKGRLTKYKFFSSSQHIFFSSRVWPTLL